MSNLELSVKVFADGADLAEMTLMSKHPIIKGFTTNPTLMKKNGINDYQAFANEALSALDGYPISFEVFADELDEMERQARIISSWGESVYVKIPVTTTSGASTGPIISRLSRDGVKLNVTAIFTIGQMESVLKDLSPNVPSYISIFAGRIADTGIDPVPVMSNAVEMLARSHKLTELIWASPRELLNVFQANQIGCHVITATADIIKKLDLAGKDLEEFSLETVKMFYDDAASAGFSL